MTRNDPSDDWIDIDQLSRRRVLYTGAAAGLAGLAGCSGDGSDGGSDGGDGGSDGGDGGSDGGDGGSDGGDGGSDGGDGGSDGGDGGSTATPTPTAEPVTLEAASWGEEQEQSIVKAILENYANQQPSVETVEYSHTPFDEYGKKLQTQFAGNNEPDVFYLISDDAPDFMRNGALLGLNEYLEGDDEFNLDGIYEGILEAFTFDGTIYGIPKDISPIGWFHNTAHLESAGASAPETWSDVRSAAEAIKSSTDVEYPVALGSSPRNTIVQLIWQNGGRVLSEDMSEAQVGSEEAIEALSWVNGLVEDDLAGLLGQDIDGTWGAPALGKQQTSMMMTGAWTIGTLKDKYSDVYDATEVSMVKPDGGERRTIVFTTSWSASANTEAPEQAAGLVKALNDEEGMWKWVSTGNALPSRPALLERDFYDDRPMLKSLGELGEVGSAFLFGPQTSKVLDALMTECEATLTGDKAPETAMKDAQRQINNAL